jgi:hypothetical protein
MHGILSKVVQITIQISNNTILSRALFSSTAKTTFLGKEKREREKRKTTHTCDCGGSYAHHADEESETESHVLSEDKCI